VGATAIPSKLVEVEDWAVIIGVPDKPESLWPFAGLLRMRIGLHRSKVHGVAPTVFIQWYGTNTLPSV
jgi:hypothetical protein